MDAVTMDPTPCSRYTTPQVRKFSTAMDCVQEGGAQAGAEAAGKTARRPERGAVAALAVGPKNGEAGAGEREVPAAADADAAQAWVVELEREQDGLEADLEEAQARVAELLTELHDVKASLVQSTDKARICSSFEHQPLQCAPVKRRCTG